jgi:hypothetical protein
MQKILCALILFLPLCLSAQVKISETPGIPHPAAVLELAATNKGLLIPRVSHSQMLAIATDAQSTGLIVYNTDSAKQYLYSSTGWRPVGYSDIITNWQLNGNSGLGAANFIGTTDSVDFVARAKNLNRLVLKANGYTGINTSNPSSMLTLQTVNQPFDNDDVLLESYAPGNGTPSYKVFSYRGTPAAPQNMGVGDYLGGLVMGGRVGNDKADFITGIYSFFLGRTVSGTDRSNMYFFNGGNISMYLDEFGKVGLGTTSPQAGLEVVNDNDFAALKQHITSSSYSTVTWPQFNAFRSRGSRTLPQNITASDLVGELSFEGQIGGRRQSVASLQATYLGNGTGFNTAGRLSFYTSARERMVLDSSGFLGLGTRDPQAALDILNNGATDGYDDVKISSYGANTGPAILLLKSKGTISVPQNLSTGDFLGILAFRGRVGSQDQGLSEIVSNYTGNGTTVRSNLQFKTSGNLGMHLDDRGWLTIGSPSDIPTATADIRGSVRFRIAAPALSLYSATLSDLFLNITSGSATTIINLENLPAFDGHFIIIRNNKSTAINVGTTGILSCQGSISCGSLDAGSTAGYVGSWNGSNMQWIQLF